MPPAAMTFILNQPGQICKRIGTYRQHQVSAYIAAYEKIAGKCGRKNPLHHHPENTAKHVQCPSIKNKKAGETRHNFPGRRAVISPALMPVLISLHYSAVKVSLSPSQSMRTLSPSLTLPFMISPASSVSTFLCRNLFTGLAP